jgi:sialate O-acetylesterase
MITRISYFVFVFLSSIPAFGKITLPSVIAGNMVLQQKTEVALWGRAKNLSNVTVIVSWNNKTYSVKSGTDGNWKLYVKTPSAGGPYSISFSDGEKLVLKDILIGEVWLCSGQSNMEMPVQGFKNQPILHSNELLMDAENPQIRLFRLERALSRTLQNDCIGTGWENATAQSVKEFSAVGYQYAKILQQKLKVPVGVIMSTWGGTNIESWMNENSLIQFPQIKILSSIDTSKIIKNEPTVLFKGMIHPVVGFGIKGVLWYQGEANRHNPQDYDKLMAAMVSEWRQIWNSGEWSFYYVQISPFAYNDKAGPAAPLREAQQKAMKQIPNSGMVVSMDVGEEKLIHPADKTTISNRLAYWALANDYGIKGLAYASPVYQSMKVEKNVVKINFENAPNGLSSFGKTIVAFEIAGEDKIFHPAEARITADGIVVQSESVKIPVAVRYAFKDWVIGDVYNTEGLPLAPFRTDKW